MTRETPGLTTLLNVSLAIYLEGIEGKLTGGCFSAGQSNYGTAIAERPSRSLCRNQCVSPNMNSQEAWKRLANQLQKAGVSGGRGSIPGGKGAFAGGGLLIALVAGGIALNASLFNGTCARLSIPRMSHRTLDSRWWSPCYQIYSVRGSALRLPVSCLWARNRLQGIGQEVYPEGTHLMVSPSLELLNPKL